MQKQQKQETVIACSLEAIDSEEREEHITTAEEILNAVLETQEKTHGYAFKLPNETAMLNKVVKWIANERLCCPFFTFTLTVNEECWLQISGNDGVKDFIHAEFVSNLEQRS